MKKWFSVLLVLAMILLGGCAPKKADYTVKFYDGETVRYITEVQMKADSLLTVPDEIVNEEEGRSVKGLYMTSTLSAKYPEGTKVTSDMVVFIAWQYDGEEPEMPTQEPTEEPTDPQGPAQAEYVIGDIPMVFDEEMNTWHAEIVMEAGAEAIATDRSTGETFKLGVATNAGSYMALLRLGDGEANVLEQIGYYVVGTCGDGGWEKDVTVTNTKYRMTLDGGVYVIDVSFGDGDIGADNKVTFKVARGAAGVVTNWYGDASGNNLSVAPGNHTITFDPASQEVLFG